METNLRRAFSAAWTAPERTAASAFSTLERGQTVGSDVYLGTLGTDRNSRLVAGTVLGHEAYRDGVKGSVVEQKLETYQAVKGHTEMALKMEADGYRGMIGSDADLARDVAYYKAGQETFAAYVGASYDSSADYWKLKLDGTLEWDGSKDLNIEYVDVDGQVKMKNAHISDDSGSYTQSLMNYVGEERAKELLSKTAYAEELNSPGFQALSQGEKRERMGQLLMQSEGMAFTHEGWVNGGSHVGFSMTDRKDLGQVVINRNEDGSYERYAVNSYIFRDQESWDSTFSPDRPDAVNKKGLDSMMFVKRDLEGNTIASSMFGGIQTVDVIDRVVDRVDRDQPYYLFGKGQRQGNTLVGDLAMTYFPARTQGLPAGDYYAEAGKTCSSRTERR